MYEKLQKLSIESKFFEFLEWYGTMKGIMTEFMEKQLYYWKKKQMYNLPKTQWLHNGGGADVRLPLALVVTRKLPYLVQIFSIKISRNEGMTNAIVLIPFFGVNFRFSSVNWTLGHCILWRVCNQPPTSANEDFQNNFIYHSVKKI